MQHLDDAKVVILQLTRKEAVELSEILYLAKEFNDLDRSNPLTPDEDRTRRDVFNSLQDLLELTEEA